MKKTIFFLHLIISLTLVGQTNVTNNIFANTNWTKPNSPYIIKNDIVIFQGAKLTVDKGVEIQIDNGFKINLQGELLLNGAISDSILVHSSANIPSNSAWIGIHFNGLGKIKMNCTIIKDAMYGLNYVYSSLPQTDSTFITSSRFTHNFRGITDFPLSRPSIYIRNCTFNLNTSGINGGESKNIYVSKCKFFNNKGGIGDSLTGGGLNINIDSCNFYNNKSGAGVNLHASGSITNSNFYNNLRGLFLVMDGYGYPFIKNNIYNNSVGIYFIANSPSMDSLDGGGSAICTNTINLHNAAQINFKIKNVCWCSNDSAYIRSTIKDGYNTNLLGLVNYNPFLKNCGLITSDKITEQNLLNAISIYPNPATSNVFFNNYSETTKIEAILFDITGKFLLSQEINNKNNIDLSGFNDGLYILSIKTNNTIVNKKLVIVK